MQILVAVLFLLIRGQYFYDTLCTFCYQCLLGTIWETALHSPFASSY